MLWSPSLNQQLHIDCLSRCIASPICASAIENLDLDSCKYLSKQLDCCLSTISKFSSVHVLHNAKRIHSSLPRPYHSPVEQLCRHPGLFVDECGQQWAASPTDSAGRSRQCLPVQHHCQKTKTPNLAKLHPIDQCADLLQWHWLQCHQNNHRPELHRLDPQKLN